MITMSLCSSASSSCMFTGPGRRSKPDPDHVRRLCAFSPNATEMKGPVSYSWPSNCVGADKHCAIRREFGMTFFIALLLLADSIFLFPIITYNLQSSTRTTCHRGDHQIAQLSRRCTLEMVRLSTDPTNTPWPWP
jgi:hypothetical protein